MKLFGIGCQKMFKKKLRKDKTLEETVLVRFVLNRWRLSVMEVNRHFLAAKLRITFTP